MISDRSPLHAVYRLIKEKQYAQAVVLAEYYPASTERRALECVALLVQQKSGDAAGLMPSAAEELPAIARILKSLSAELGIGWDFLDPGARMTDNSYLKYLCLELIGAERLAVMTLPGYPFRTLARHGMQKGDWCFARLCLERALEVDGSPVGLVEAAKLVLRLQREAGHDAWQGPAGWNLVVDALSSANSANARADFFPEGAFLLLSLSLDSGAEEWAAELVNRAAQWFPDHHHVLLAGCVRLAAQAVAGGHALLAVQIARIGANLVRDLSAYLQMRAADLDGQLKALRDEHDVYSNAWWYQESEVHGVVLQLLARAGDYQVSRNILRLMQLSAFPAEWRVDWMVHALVRCDWLPSGDTEQISRWADTLPEDLREALLHALPRAKQVDDTQRDDTTKLRALSGSRASYEESFPSREYSVGQYASFLRLEGFDVHGSGNGFDNEIVGSRLPRLRLPSPPARSRKKSKKRRVERYTRVQFPEVCELEQKADLKLQLAVRPPAETRVSRKVAVEVDPEVKEVSLTVVLTAPGFATDSPVRTMVMPVEGDSEEVVFPLFPLSKGEKTLEVEVFHGAERVTYLLVRTRVEYSGYLQWVTSPKGSDRGDAPGLEPSIAIVEQFHPRLSGRARRPRVSTGRRVLHVTWLPGEDKLGFRVFSPERSEEHAEEHTRPGLHGVVCDELRRLNEFLFDVVTYDDPTDEEWDALQLNLRAKGLMLAELLLPHGLREQVRTWPANSTVVIDTNEQWIPWEILHDGADLLGLRFVLARAPRHDQRAQSLQSVRRHSRPRRTLSYMVNVVGGEVEKRHADRAVRTFTRFSPPLRVHTLLGEPVSALEKVLPGADALHLTCHGQVEPHLLQVAKTSSQALNLLPDSVRVLPLKRGSMVFANSCGSDRGLVMFGNFTSFGWEFYRHGADVFIGTLGAVPTVHAIYFAEQLYGHLLGSANGRTIGAVVKEARDLAGEQRNLFSLLYCLYGDPDTLVSCRGPRSRARKTLARPRQGTA